ELKTLWATCPDDDFGAILRLLILTGCRRDEIGGLKWSEINLETGVLHIPASRTKSHRDLVLPLPAAAIDIVKSRQRHSNREYVFGARGGAFCRWSWEKRVIDARLGNAVGMWRLHDIRRTVRSGLGKIGVPPHIAELVLNHAGHKSGIGGVYDRY